MSIGEFVLNSTCAIDYGCSCWNYTHVEIYTNEFNDYEFEFSGFLEGAYSFGNDSMRYNYDG
jgi:hypothetical protein